MAELAQWGNFYVIVGSSAGALIGLQFVVIALLSEVPIAPEAGEAFSTPNVIHFAVVLFLSAVATAPWQDIGTADVLWALVGVLGLVYTVAVAGRMRAQHVYHPVFEDWLFHLLVPLAAYALLACAAGVVRSHTRAAFFLAGAAPLVLLFVGIHNAWDTVTYHVFVRKREARRDR